MLEFLTNALLGGHQCGFVRTRIWANMEWALSGAPGVEALAEYENEFNRLLPQFDDAVVCAYDVTRFTAGILENVVRAHPYLLADGWGRKNQHYIPPNS
jgi:DcmR-like sensory protein